MKNTNISQAEILKKESVQILEGCPIWFPFQDHGTIHLSGSAELDVLVYPDLDVYFDCYSADKNLLNIFGEAMLAGARFPHIISMRLETQLHKLRSHIPKGIYLQMKIQLQTRIWQIDMVIPPFLMVFFNRTILLSRHN